MKMSTKNNQKSKKKSKNVTDGQTSAKNQKPNENYKFTGRLRITICLGLTLISKSYKKVKGVREVK